MTGNRDLETRMDGATTLEKKGSNARGSNTENNLSL
jgi:hypothetical protein